MQAIKHWIFMFFHHHEWEIVSSVKTYMSEKSTRYYSGVCYTRRCKICGKMKSETLY